MHDWYNIQTANAIDAKSWDELAQQVPSIQVCGYDANTRDLAVKSHEDPASGQLWSNRGRVDGEIAPLIQSPLGDQLYSAQNTYKVNKSPDHKIIEDKERPGYIQSWCS